MCFVPKQTAAPFQQPKAACWGPASVSTAPAFSALLGAPFCTSREKEEGCGNLELLYVKMLVNVVYLLLVLLFLVLVVVVVVVVVGGGGGLVGWFVG